MEITTQKSLIYCRVSSKEQEETGYSLEAQEKLLKDYSDRHGFVVPKVYKITESASGKQIRKSLNEMMQYAEKHKVHIIACEKIDRLTRNLKDASTIDDWVKADPKREVHFVKENFVLNKNTRAHENLVWDMKVAIARFYTNNLSEEVKKGQKEKLAQGWLPTKPPLGYKSDGDKGHRIHLIDPEKAPYIRRMFELYSSGNHSTHSLVDTMYKEGLRNRNGGKVGKSRMHDLLSDPFYYGKVRWKDEIYPGEHEPIISRELFEEVQAKLARKLKAPVYRKHLPVFKAKVQCLDCGGTITWYTKKGHWYGDCNHYKGCPRKGTIRQEKVEEQLFPFFDGVAPKNERVLRLLEKALKESHAEEINYYEAQKRELVTQSERIQRRLEAIYEDKIDGKIAPEFYERKFKEYTEEKENILEKLGKLDQSNTQYYAAGFAIHELALKAKQIYQSEKATVEDRRLLLSYVFSNLTLDADKISANYTFAFEFLAEWMPKLNSTFEPAKNIANKGKTPASADVHPSWLRRQDSNLEPSPYTLPNTFVWCGLYHHPKKGASVSSLYGAPCGFPRYYPFFRIRASPISRSVSIHLSMESCDSFHREPLYH